MGAVVSTAAVLFPPSIAAFESGRAGFSVLVNDLRIPYRVFAIYVLPGETVEIAVSEPAAADEYSLDARGGQWRAQGTARWHWTAPEVAGVSQLAVAKAGERIHLNAVTMHPASSVVNERLNDYRIGSYPAEPLDDNPLYLPPDGFIELDEDGGSLELSPHFRLSQFPSKQSDVFPKYLALREQLLLKLELLLEQVNHDGIAAETFTIMSGYRTPFYNAAIGNVPYSRHVYGGAADIFIDDSPRDDFMDDLNGDGRTDYRDAQHLYRIADRLFGAEEHRPLSGGLGVYRRTRAHGPFMHVDARQQRARWGLLP